MAILRTGRTNRAAKLAVTRAPALLLINGPNLNLIGTREPEIYGSMSLDEIVESAQKKAQSLGATLDHVQSNHEGVLIDALHAARKSHDALIVNAGALGHTSIALRDAISATELPCVDLHLSNIHRREPFRHHSYVAEVSIGQITGFGPIGYLFAVEAAIFALSSKPRSTKIRTRSRTASK